ncbi:hypothetical protein [Persephonella sp. IF05-L8]|uniref:hypothetical protein n=1 Tax=Persephonella sp. IF05-L8 TaxID=1158338 RepID=UPI000496C378
MKILLILVLVFLFWFPVTKADEFCSEGNICIVSKDCIGFINKDLITDDPKKQKELLKQRLARNFKPGERVKVLSSDFFWYRAFVELLEPEKNKNKYWIDSRCLILND